MFKASAVRLTYVIRLALLVSSSLAVGLIPSASAQTNISVSQTTDLGGWGVGSNPAGTYGQTFTVPLTDTELDSFTFYLGPQQSGSGTINYQAYVYAWNPTTSAVSGSALYQSAVQTYTATGSAGYSPVSFTSDVSVTAGDEYVLFISTAGESGEPTTSAFDVAANTTGGFVYTNTLGNSSTSAWTGGWSTNYDGYDLAFNADFSAAPEPASMLLFGTGLLGILFVARKHLKPESRS